jgi:hypothetical protein
VLFAKPFVALATLPKGSFSISCTQRFTAERAGRQKKLQDLEQVTNKGSNDHYASHLQLRSPLIFVQMSAATPSLARDFQTCIAC